MPFSFLQVFFFGGSLSIFFLGLLYVVVPQVLPHALLGAYSFGKASNNFKKPKVLKTLEVPKRWFTHFYILASCCHTYLVWSLWQVYFKKQPVPKLTGFLLDISASTKRNATVAPEAITIVMVLVLLQVYRRCYECLYISVFSNTKMNICHYIVGFTYYFGVSISALAEAPGFETGGGPHTVHFTGNWFSWNHIIGAIIFLWAYKVQNQSLILLANLRKAPKGDSVVTFKHVIPSGSWFELVSCPHYMAEIVMYLAANLILAGRSTSWWLVCLWVVSNQIIAGLMSQQWYKENFQNYPKSRKAVIPLVL